MAEAGGDDGERYFEGLAGRAPASAGASALREVLLREAQAVAQAERDATGRAVTPEEQVLTQRIRAHLAAQGAWPASPKVLPRQDSRRRKALSSVLAGLGLRNAGLALAACAVLAAGWWALRERSPAAPGSAFEYQYRGDAQLVIRDANPGQRALALSDALKRLGNQGATVQVAADAWVITLEPSPAWTPAARDAVAAAIGLAAGTHPLPREILVTLPLGAASQPAS